MNKIKFLALLMVSLFAMESMAQEKYWLQLDNGEWIDLAHWMDSLYAKHPDTRIAQLSIPAAHDAGTWPGGGAFEDNSRDQTYSEAELFKRGVRFFDIRLSGKDGGKLAHGEGELLSQQFNTIEDEVQKYFPTKEQLANECMFINYSIEDAGDDWCKDDKDKERAVIRKFLLELIEKYKKEGEEVFAGIGPDTKLRDLRGKIVLFNKDWNARPCDFIKQFYNFSYPITWNDFETDGDPLGKGKYTVPFHNEIKRRRPESYISPGLIYDYSSEDADTLFFISQGEWDISNSKDKFETFKAGMDFYHGVIFDDNRKNVWAYHGLNGYSIAGDVVDRGGKSVAMTNMWGKGANELALNYLQGIKNGKPLGIVSFDFCGDDSDGLHGDMLLKEIVKHNFPTLKYISDIAVCITKKEGWTWGYDDAKKIFKDNGYEYDENVLYPKGADHVVRLGYKYTFNPTEAITDVIMVEVENDNDIDAILSVGERDLKVNNETCCGYSPAPAFGNVDGARGNFYYRNDADKKSCFLYVCKNLDHFGNRLLTDFKYSSTNGSGTFLKQGEAFSTLSWIFSENDVFVAEEQPSWDDRCTNAYFKLQYHTHAFSTCYDENSHYQVCSICGIRVGKSDAHIMKSPIPENSSNNYHIHWCRDCGYKIKEHCTFSDTINGFASCLVCKRDIYEQPKKDGDVYQISNAGQLYWFAQHINSTHYYTKAILTEDICVNENVNVTDKQTLRKWIPISAYDSKKNLSYSGKFDGNGHTISGLYSDADNAGLFGNVEYADITNLGIINSRFEGKHCASFAFYTYCTIFKNVFSTAELSGEESSGMVQNFGATDLYNGYFKGKLTGKDPSLLCRGGDDQRACVVNNFLTVNGLCPEYTADLGVFDLIRMSEHQFANGEACIQLNTNNRNPIWRQNLTRHPAPVLNGNGDLSVYVCYNHGETTPIYTNSPSYKHKTPYNHTAKTESEGNHDMGLDAQYQWTISEDLKNVECLGSFFCNTCRFSYLYKVKVEKDKDKNYDPTCTKDGQIYFTGSWGFNTNAIYTNIYEQVLPALGHDIAEGGFGCTRCEDEVYEPAELVDGKYQISNAPQLYWFSQYCNNIEGDTVRADAVLINDIGVNKDMTQDYIRIWKPICHFKSYAGVFDGQGHTISGLYDGIGLFGAIYGGTIQNLGVINSTFKSVRLGMGSFAGRIQHATLKNLYSTANLVYKEDKSNWAGGIASKILDSNIENVYYDGTVTTDGWLDGNIFENNTTNNYFVKSRNENYCQGATVVDDVDFASGKICYLLNDSTYGANAMWRQNIDATEVDATDAIPCFNTDHQMVIPAKYNGSEFIGATFSEGSYFRENVNLKDGYDFSVPVELNILDATTYKRDISNAEWGTICLPFEVESTGEVQYYKLSEYQSNANGYANIKIVPVKKVEKNTPAIFHKLSDISSLEFEVHNNTITPTADNKRILTDNYTLANLYGTYEQETVKQEFMGTKLYLSGDKFYSVNDYITVNPFRAWIESKFSQQTNKFEIVVDDPSTSIGAEDVTIDAKDFDFIMYDTSGRRIAVPQNGQIIIKNGKKQIHKK